MQERTAKMVLISMLKSDAAEGRITAAEHQEAYDKLKDMEEGHDLLYYIKELCLEN